MESEKEGTYKTIAREDHIVFKEKGSRFLAYAFSVKNDKEAKSYLEKLRKEFPDATHICYAYITGYEGTVHKSSDDGEPSGTAGKPILRQIIKAGLVNTLVAVVRYFGGSLLGTGGLIQAYGTAAAEVISACGHNVSKRYVNYLVQLPFGSEHEIYRMASQYDMTLSVIPDDLCFCAEIKIPLQYVGIFLERFKGNSTKPEHPGTE